MLWHLLIFSLILGSVSAETDSGDVDALRALYGALNSPRQLKGWKSRGGDPCGGETWFGILCSGTSIISIRINGMRVGGTLGLQLSGFKSLKQLDVSDNAIGGTIPFALPPNATHLHLSHNRFVMNIPFSLLHIESLIDLNLSHNSLSGPIEDVFTNLHNLKEMDLSFNSFSGDLPSLFSSLTNLHELYLQENKFTGSIEFLADLPLFILNLENNGFCGVVPKQLESIDELRIDGNMLRLGNETISSSDFCEPSSTEDKLGTRTQVVPFAVKIVLPFLTLVVALLAYILFRILQAKFKEPRVLTIEDCGAIEMVPLALQESVH